jgi:ligand-binding SRPBCC domain-containing protein
MVRLDSAAGPFQVRSEMILPRSREDTFAFFADAANLERITPPWLHFTIRTPLPIAMREGITIRYRIRWHGVPIPWLTHIDAWEPPSRFVDRQVWGPYRLWRHEHLFEEVTGGTRVIDRVDYVPRLSWATARIVQRDVERIFEYRRATLLRLASNAGGGFGSLPRESA